jgi:hypothetical protein
MCVRLTLKDLSSVTSLPELAGGPWLSDLLDGLMTAKRGLDRARASRSARQGSKKALPMPDIYGLSGSGSLNSLVLSQFLGSRLRALVNGSTLFRETWKIKATPSGRQFWAHTASGRRTSGRESTTLEPWSSPRSNKWGFPDAHGSHEAPWPTAIQNDAEKRGIPKVGAGLAGAAYWPTAQSHDDRLRGNTNADHHHYPHDLPNMSNWVSPQKGDGDRGGQAKRYLAKDHAVRLNDQALTTAATWATPSTRDHKDGACQEQLENGTVEVNSLLGRQVLGAAWNTPRSTDGSNGGPSQANGALSHDAAMSTWPTPQATEAGTINQSKSGGPPSSLKHTAQKLSGVIASGSPASTANHGQLNPAFSLWLQGFPTEWALCAARVTRLSRKSPKRS